MTEEITIQNNENEKIDASLAKIADTLSTVTPQEIAMRAEIDMQIATAKQWPRSIAKFLEQAISLATMDEKTARSCIYRVPRAGTSIEGKSVRLAEICAPFYRNLRVSGRVTQITDTEVIAEAIAMDLENNFGYNGEARRRITDKNGKRFTSDMIIMTANAAIAIATRNATFKAIPLPLIQKVYDAAKKVAVGDASTLVQKREKMLEHFIDQGVSRKQVFDILKVGGIEEITLNHLEEMIGYATALESGESVDNIFNAAAVVEPTGEKVDSQSVERPNIEQKKIKKPGEQISVI